MDTRETFDIHFPEFRLGEFKGKFKAFSKRAAKAGVEAPEVSFTEYFRDGFVFVKATVKATSIRKRPGYEIVARVSPQGKYNDIVVLDGTDGIHPIRDWLKAQYGCDHCGHNRYRTHVFMVLNTETGEYMRIGSSCLKKYLGVSAMSAMYIAEFRNDCAPLSDEPVASSVPLSALASELEDVVNAAIAVIAKDGGYVKSDEGYGTKETVQYLLFAGSECDKLREQYAAQDSDKQAALAGEIIANWKGIDPAVEGNDFRVKLGVIAESGFVKFNQIGIIAGAVGRFIRERAKANEKANLPESCHFGTEGKRDVFTLVPQAMYTFDTMYGLTTMIKGIQEGTGNVFVWCSTNGGKGMIDGDTGELITCPIKVKATVKAHEKHAKYGVQTKINRVSVM